MQPRRRTPRMFLVRRQGDAAGAVLSYIDYRGNHVHFFDILADMGNW
ncbi:MAG: hypothetical protein R2873_08745 [Caldilineaceae bacterium]